ncbi:MAG: zinc-dependent alcohol dehydrogenase family protein [Pseudomonadota bacterium]
MKAAVLEAYRGQLDIREVPDPACPVDGAVIAVHACGVCRSDHHAWVGADPDVALPHVMGHEFAGEVIEVGPQTRRFRVGDRVTAPFILGCGACADCRAGQPTICATQNVIGFTFWGSFAEAVAIPAADFNLVSLPESLGMDAAAGMGCRVTTAWRALVDRAGLRPGEWVAVHGCGGVGLAALQIASALGARVVAVDISQGALDQAAALGAEHCVNGAEINDVPEAVRAVTGGGVHVSLDALGIAATFDASLRSLRKLGRHVQVGMPVGDHSTVSLPLLELVYARQLSLFGMRGLGAAAFDPLMRLIEGGHLDPARLVTQRIALGALEGALRAMDGGQPPGVTVVTRFDT